MPTSKAAWGQVTSPAAGGPIAVLAAPGAGVWQIYVTTYKAGTDDLKYVNASLRIGGIVKAVLVTGILRPSTHFFPFADVNAGETITINAEAAGGAGSIYVASLVAHKVG